MTTFRALTFALLSACVIPASVLAQGQVSWAIADRPGDKIEALVSRLEPFLEPLPGREGAPGAVLYHQILIAPDEGESRRCENLILTIEDPAAMPEELMQPRQTGTDEVTSMSAFVRSGGEYRSLGEDEIVHVAGREDIGRGHFEINWGDLQQGDVVGWSMVTSREQLYDYVPIRLAQRIPIVLAALQVQSNGEYAYDLRTNAVSLKDVKQKKDDVVDGRAMSIKVSTNQRPPMDEVPDELPWANDFPSMALYLKEVKIDPDSQFLLPGWASAGGWNQSFMGLGGLVRSGAEELGSLEITLSAITTGKSAPAAKTEAVFNWVRDKVTLLEGPDIARGGTREFEEIVRSKEATEVEKVMLMGAILEKLEIEATVAAVRRSALGDFDHGWPNIRQISDIAIRTVEDGQIRYWAPQCGACEPGEVPASWKGSQVVTFDFATIEVAEEFQEELRNQAMVEGQLDIATTQAQVEAQPWTIFERIPD
jgi:hypothetical protein